MDTRNVLNVVFGLSAAGSLREALKKAGRPDEVIGFIDDLSCGPTDAADVEARVAFFEDGLGYDMHQGYAQEIEAFWQSSLDASRPRIVWLSRWSTLEYCNFLAWLERNGDALFELVDLTDTWLPNWREPSKLEPVKCTSLVLSGQFEHHRLWDRAAPPEPLQMHEWTTIWDRLRAESAPLRIIMPDGLVSAPVEHFDADLLTQVGDDWIDARRVVGETMGAMMDNSFREGGVYQCGDLVLFSRVRRLVEAGVLKKKGRLNSATFKVRRA